MTLVIIAALPPPIHGQSLVTDLVLADVVRGARPGTVAVFNTSPGSLARKRADYHSKRTKGVLRGLWGLLSNGLSRPGRLYTVYEAGLGVAYNLVTIGLARMLGYEIFIHHHTSKHTLAHSKAFSVLSRVAGGAATHIALSPAMADDLKRRYPAVRRVVELHNAAVIPSPSKHSTRAVRGPLKLGLLSNLLPEKGVDLALEVALAARREGLDVSLTLAGPVPTSEVETLISDASKVLGDRLTVLGSVSGDCKQRFLEKTDVFLFPTRYRYEAQPLVLLEAMSFGASIITRDVGYIAELVGSAGLVLPCDDDFVEEAVRCLRTLAGAPGELAASSNASRSRFAELAAVSRTGLASLAAMLLAV